MMYSTAPPYFKNYSNNLDNYELTLNNLHILLCYDISKMNLSFSIEKSYSNFKELEDEIALYEKQEFVNLRKVNGL